MKVLKVETLRSLLNYEPAVGVFIRKIGIRGHKAGSTAGHVNAKGYVEIVVGGGRYKAHRLAWFYVHGLWPSLEIDHKNGDRSDNRLANLREATRAENLQNRHAKRKNSSSKLLGVTWHSQCQKWLAQIKVDGVNHSLGLFNSEEEAHVAYLTAKRSKHPFWLAR